MFILITGGSKHGKSHLAEQIFSGYDLPKYYIATMEPYGKEAQAAIARHQRMRSGKGFQTIEQYTNLGAVELPAESAVLVECLCNLCANEMFSVTPDHVTERICTDIETILQKTRLLVVVTSQVGEDGIAYPPETMQYIRAIGLLNQWCAQRADVVIEAVYGIPVLLKGACFPWESFDPFVPHF